MIKKKSDITDAIALIDGLILGSLTLSPSIKAILHGARQALKSCEEREKMFRDELENVLIMYKQVLRDITDLAFEDSIYLVKYRSEIARLQTILSDL